jgi:hypothetical protein
VPNGFGIGRSLERLAPSLEGVLDRLARETSLRAVASHELGLRLHHLRELFTQHASNAAVQLLAPALQQGVVSNVTHKRVLEAVSRLRQRALTKDQLGLDQPVQPVTQLVMAERSHRREQLVAELATDSGADLRHLLRRCEPVEPREERIVQGCWNCQWR